MFHSIVYSLLLMEVDAGSGVKASSPYCVESGPNSWQRLFGVMCMRNGVRTRHDVSVESLIRCSVMSTER